MVVGWRAEPRVGTRSGARLRIGHTGDCTLSTSAAGASTDPPRPAQPSAGRLGVSSPAQGASGHLCRSGSADQEQEPRLWEGPPLQGDFVRRVVARPAPTRGRGTSMYRSDEIPLQRRPSRRGVPRFGARFVSACRSQYRRSHGHTGGERRGSAGIGRKQALDGLRSPVGAMDCATRRCARSPHCRGSPRTRQIPVLWPRPEARTTAAPPEANALRRFSTWPDPASLTGEEPQKRPGR